MNIFEKRESEVRSYCRSFPTVFTKAKMEKLYDDKGKEYIDFFAGAGALNYGHNNDYIKKPILEYIENDGIIHALDMYAQPKAEFLEAFEQRILNPRKLDYKVMCCGPTGTNANEAAMKLARKVKNRPMIFSFTGAFHGMTMGSLSLTSSVDYQKSMGVTPPGGVAFMPYPRGFFKSFDTIRYIEEMITDDHSGTMLPAAIFLETVQGEGGINVADVEWLQRLRALCDKYDILLVVDDIQLGCGRTGNFFSFERAGIVPDMVTLSKSISGYGMPMALLLLKPELDIFKPGEHNGTFRGLQLAFIGAKAALEYRDEFDVDGQTRKKEKIVKDYFKNEIEPLSEVITTSGIGLAHGINVHEEALSRAIMHECFENGLVLERAGRHDEVVKLMPPLIIQEDNLLKGLDIIKQSIKKCMHL